MSGPPVKTPASGTRPGLLRRAGRFWLRPVLAAALLWAAFPPLRLVGTIFLAWIPLLSLIQEDLDAPPGKRPGKLFLRIWAAGGLSVVGLLYWILALSNEQVTVPGLMVPSLLLIASYLGLFFILVAWLLRCVGRHTGLPLGLLFPVFWTAVEWLRTQGPLGFPWGIPGYAMARFPSALQMTAWTGFWGLTVWIGAVTGLLHEGLRRVGAPRRGFLPPLAAALIVLILPPAMGHLRLAHAPPPRDALRGDGGPVFGIVQPNVVREVKWKAGGAQASWEKLRDGTRRAVAQGAEVVVWPETALPLRLLQQPAYLEVVKDLVRSGDVALLTGTLYSEGEWGSDDYRIHNSALLIRPDGTQSDIYHKQKLVPFSERMPLQKIVPWLTSIDFGQSDFTAGTRLAVFRTGSVTLAPLICFESIFPEQSRAFANAGANVLVNVTNDFWFGDSPGPVQHAEMAILRAAETGLPLVRCANTGISFFVDPYGRLVESLGTFRDGVLIAEVGPGTAAPSTRLGPWLVRALCAAAVLLGLLALSSALRRRGTRPEGVPR